MKGTLRRWRLLRMKVYRQAMPRGGGRARVAVGPSRRVRRAFGRFLSNKGSCSGRSSSGSGARTGTI